MHGRNGVVALLLVGACEARVPLSDVPIVGGTAEQREAVRDELAAFDGWVGPDRLQIVEVRFADLDPVVLGQFRPSQDDVKLNRDLAIGEVRWVVRHELCHALDYAEGLVEQPSPLFDHLVTQLKGQAGPTDRARRSEVLAEACNVGPFGAEALATQPCPADPPEAEELFGWIARHVWSEYDPADPAAPLGPALASGPAPEAGPLSVSPSVEPGLVDVVGLPFAVDLHTGEPSGQVPAAGDAANPPPTTTPLGGVVRLGVGWPSGPGAAVVDYTLKSQGPAGSRLVWSDGLDWSPVGCVDASDDWDLFTAEDQVWYAWREQAVSWTPIGD
jgi:hypothetical protein